MIARGVGYIVRTLGETLIAALPAARVGAGACIYVSTGRRLGGQVVAVERARVTIVPFGSVAGVGVGDRVECDDRVLAVPLGYRALGRALDATGLPLDGKGALPGLPIAVARDAIPLPGARAAVRTAFWTGVRAIDGLLTIGRGARVGIFGAPGAGKTTLLETIARSAAGDAIVLALIGERGREARDWFVRIDKRTTIVCATSDRSPAERSRAADVAMTQARLLRDHGLHVVLIIDSLARYAAALREQRVALGEPVGRGGYPASVWADLARYLECAGNARAGSITLIATVLSDGSDEREPLSDAARSLLDGHIVLSSDLARAGHFPAIDVLASASRTMHDVVPSAAAADARRLRGALAALLETKDARSLGLAVTDARLKAAIAAEPKLEAFLCQRTGVAWEQTRQTLRSVAALLEVTV